MSKAVCQLLLLSLCILGLVPPSPAQELFHLGYDREVLAADSRTVSGLITLYVNNHGGADLKDAVAWISGANQVTYDNRIIYLGDIAAGSARGVTEHWSVPTGMTVGENPDFPPIWTLEYTDPSGVRVSTEIIGSAMR